MSKFLPLIFLLFSLPLICQVEVSDTLAMQITAELDLANEQLSAIQKYNSAAKGLQLDIHILHGELQIVYTLPLRENAKSFKPELSIELDGKKVSVKPERLKGAYEGQIPYTVQPVELLWTNLLEDYLNLQGTLRISLGVIVVETITLPYNVDCNAPIPEFDRKQRLPYYLSAGAGAIAIGLGQIFRVQSEKEYEDYLAQTDGVVAGPIYEGANQKNHAYYILSWSGAAVLTADAILFYTRQSRQKKRRRVYDEFCGDKKKSLTIQPLIDFPNGKQMHLPNGMVGVSFNYTF